MPEEFAFENLNRFEQWTREATLRRELEIRRMADYLEAVRLREITPDGFEGIPWLAGKAE